LALSSKPTSPSNDTPFVDASEVGLRKLIHHHALAILSMVEYQQRVDPNVPIEGVAGVVKDLMQQGKVKQRVVSGRIILFGEKAPRSAARDFVAHCHM